MTTDIDDLEIIELEELTKRAKLLIEKKQKEKIDVAYAQLLTTAESVGLSLDELIAYGTKRQQVTEKRTVAPRYRSTSDATQTWTGRGKKPRWVVEALENGQTLDDLLIK